MKTHKCTSVIETERFGFEVSYSGPGHEYAKIRGTRFPITRDFWNILNNTIISFEDTEDIIYRKYTGKSNPWYEEIN
tara:strand:+ start:139 stop:369 length:231 start_codon:yes stop_codon:yes gene_type:complete